MEAGWFKSTHSTTKNDSCVEVRFIATAVEVRDTKDRPGGTLSFASAAWRGLLESTKSGRAGLR
ncbi:DUF397 domain-containing protein [Amycolatopsis anabasis]|uniref:DUF397 domain-containing protein n=1 Tax=Amycolatopsis anabasis TaxID=1840409 RepID=UPI00131C8BEE